VIYTGAPRKILQKKTKHFNEDRNSNLRPAMKLNYRNKDAEDLLVEENTFEYPKEETISKNAHAWKRNAPRNDSLELYMTEVGKIALLTREQETSLAYRIRNGDTLALNALVSANLRFVVSVAKRYPVQGTTLSDRIQEGNTGLLRAAESFNPDLSVKFISYAVWWIRKYIESYVGHAKSAVYIPEHKRYLLYRLEQFVNGSKSCPSFYSQHRRKPTAEDIAKKFTLPVENASFFLHLLQQQSSIENISLQKWYPTDSNERPFAPGRK
jgi:RNA polymerase sigma factor (sigma-70 family)